MQEILTKTPDGTKKHLIDKQVSKGNLDWMFQRIDTAILESTKEKPTRVYLKVGKVKHEEDDFRNDKETAQSYYFTYEGEIMRFIKSLLIAHRKILMLDNDLSELKNETLIHQYVNMVINTFRERK